MNLAIFTIVYLASFFLASADMYIASGCVLLAFVFFKTIRDVKKLLRGRSSVCTLSIVFTLSYLGGVSLSAMKLSHLQTSWSYITWICFYLMYIVFQIVLRLLNSHTYHHQINSTKSIKLSHSRLYICIVVLTLISSMCFCVEAYLLGFIPFFTSGVPHAYSTFHITGVHYFTVSCVLVPALCIVWIYTPKPAVSVSSNLLIAICFILSLGIPILCVSRFQFVFAVGLMLVTWALMRRESMGVVLPLVSGVGVVAVYIILTVARAHSVDYLNSIFEMKYELPIFVTQPYMYIANNFDNFDCLVRQLPEFAHGIRMLYPIFVFTGLKFKCPQLVSLPIYVNKEELTTLTIGYDAYYDFGVVGIAAFALLLGVASWIFENRIRLSRNAIGYVLYGQFFIYIALAFFTTWFSNPTTWFYFGITTIVFLICSKGR